MKLAIAIFRYFPFGGLQRDMLAIAEEAYARGHSVTVFCGDWQGAEPEGIEVVSLAGRPLFNTAGIQQFVLGFQQRFVRSDFDVLLGFNKMPGLDVYFCGDSCFAQKAYGERSWLYRLTPRARLYLAYERALFDVDAATQILEVSSAERNLFAKYYATQQARFTLLPPGIARTHALALNPTSARHDIRAELNTPAAAKVVLCVGSGFKTKGLNRSLEVFAQARRLAPQVVQLWVVGQGDTQTYSALAQRLGIAAEVKFLGARTDMAAIYAAADMLLHCAHREVAGNVLLEAMLAGLPVLATSVCGYGHYVVEQNMGDLIAEPFDVEPAAQQLLTWLTADRALLAERAQAFALDGDVFARPQRAVDYLEGLVFSTSIKAESQAQSVINSPCQGYRQNEREQVILRAELAEQWRAQDVFALVKALQGPIAREMVDRQTLRFEMNGCGYYRKLHRGVGWSEIFKNLLQLRLPVLGAQNEWDALNRLQALGVPSLTPLAFGRRGANPARQESFIVTRELEGVTQLDHFFEQQSPSVQQRRAIIRRLAEVARGVHQAGINHRDFYLCHFMLKVTSCGTLPEVNAQGEWQPELYVMDLHRAQCRAQVPYRWLVKDLSGLYFSSMNLSFSARDYYRFLRVYFAGSLRDIMREQGALLRAVARKALHTYKRDFGHLPRRSFTFNDSL